MYICLCNGYRTSDIAQAAARHRLNDAEAVYQALGCGPNCGKCLDAAQEIIDRTVDARPARLLAAE